MEDENPLPPIKMPGEVHLLKIPTPFPDPTTINVYLLEGRSPTLIDTGPKTSKAREALQGELRRVGYGLSDIQKVILTHYHIDHIGLAKWIVDNSRAETYLHASEASVLPAFWEREQDRIQTQEAILAQAGMPQETLVELRGLLRSIHGLAEPCPITHHLQGGEKIEAGNHILEAIPTPGHTVGGISFLMAEERMLFVGDALLGYITPVIMKYLYHETERRSLKDYLATLNRLQTLAVDLALPAHGPPINPLHERAREVVRHHEERLRAMLKILKTGPKTPFQIAQSHFDPHNPLDHRLAVLETLAHLELLEEEGNVRRIEAGDKIRYSLTP